MVSRVMNLKWAERGKSGWAERKKEWSEWKGVIKVGRKIERLVIVDKKREWSGWAGEKKLQ